VAALSLFQRRRWLPGLLVLALAAHVKLTALLLAPALGVWLLRRVGWRRSAQYALATLAIALPLSWLLYAPLGGWATLPRMLGERTLFLAASPANVVYRWLYDTQSWGAPDARVAVQHGSTLLFAALALLLLARAAWAPHAHDDPLLWSTAGAVTLAYLAVGSFWFQHWYLLLALAPASLLPRSAMIRLVLPWYGFGALSANVAANMLGALWAPGRLALAATEVAVILTPPGLALLIAAGLAWASRSNAAIARNI
jgi:hypothetical protein